MITIKKSDLDELVMTGEYFDKHLTDSKPYYKCPAGVEHYRFLTYLSGCFNNSVILDVGTFTGASALALSTNKTNKVLSYDIAKHGKADFSDIPNIQFMVKDILTEDPKVILGAKMILYDISPHNGKDEENFVNHLMKLGYTGVVIFDDLNVNGSMSRYFWENVTLPKIDLTEIGHGSGTGAVFFGEERIEIG